MLHPDWAQYLIKSNRTNLYNTMRNAVFSYMIAILLIACWAIGFFMLSVNILFHLLLILALILIVLTVINKEKTPLDK